MRDFKHALSAVQKDIAGAAETAGRNAENVHLLAVSKRHPISAIRALASVGQRAFGENYVSEAVDKIESTRDMALEWHFIGPIQSNKTAAIAQHFDWVHSIAREKVLRRLNHQRPDGLAPLNCCLQIHIGGEASKSGAPADLAATLLAAAEELPRLRLRGLMCIPPASNDVAEQRGWFAELRELFDQLCAAGYDLDTLSMGMSNDLVAAVAEGATIVRVGTALFGPRPQ